MNTFKFYTATILTLVVFLFSIKSAFWLSYYMIFTDNFIENYCENTDKPELECDGKCFLSDVLDKKTQDTPKNASLFLDVELIFTNSINNEYSEVKKTLHFSSPNYFYNNNYAFLFIDSSFKPPSLGV